MTDDQNSKRLKEDQQGWLRLEAHFAKNGEKSVRILSLKPGQTLVRTQDAADKVYLLLSGTVTVQNEHADGTIYAFASFEAPSLFGEFEAFAGNDQYRGTLVCQTACRFAVMGRGEYLAFMRSDVDALFFRMRDITRQLIHQARNERRFLFMTGTERLAAYLCACYEKWPGFGTLTLHLTHQQLADEIGVSVKTVYRTLMTLKEQGLITTCGRKLIMDSSQYARLQKRFLPTQGNPDLEE